MQIKIKAILMKVKVRSLLLEMAESKYRDFAQKLLPGIDGILGVRLPKLRKVARSIAKKDWRTYLEVQPDHFEEIMLQGMLIGYVQLSYKRKINLIEVFIPKIDNWSVCDSFCCGLKFEDRYKDKVWAFLTPYFTDEHEYKVRFAVVMALSYYIDEKYLGRVFSALNRVCHEGYYAQMAVAWAVSICFVKYPQETMRFLAYNQLDEFAYQKALQKITESLKVDAKAKEFIRWLKNRHLH